MPSFAASLVEHPLMLALKLPDHQFQLPMEKAGADVTTHSGNNIAACPSRFHLIHSFCFHQYHLLLNGMPQ
jgi:hypothetical protein